MTLSLGQKLKIRAMIYVAGEAIPFFWPMRSFIHHNPLHGLEHMTFDAAVERGQRLFHARGYLPRSVCQRYLAEGQIDREVLATAVDAFAAAQPDTAGIDLARWLMALLTETQQQGGCRRCSGRAGRYDRDHG